LPAKRSLMAVIAAPLRIIVTTIAVEAAAVGDNHRRLDDFCQNSSATAKQEANQDGDSLFSTRYSPESGWL
jgi:hypothetical protein